MKYLTTLLLAVGLSVYAETRATEDCVTPSEVMEFIVGAHADSPEHSVHDGVIQLTGPAKLKFEQNTQHPRASDVGKVVIYAVTFRGDVL